MVAGSLNSTGRETNPQINPGGILCAYSTMVNLDLQDAPAQDPLQILVSTMGLYVNLWVIPGG